jgi:Immunity protein 8
MLCTMRAHLHALFAPHLGQRPLSEYQPDDPERFAVNVQAFIGSEPDSPADSFDFLVCTPRWFAEAYDATDLRRSAERSAPLAGPSARHQLLGQPTHRPTRKQHSLKPRGRLLLLRSAIDFGKCLPQARFSASHSEAPIPPVAST